MELTDQNFEEVVEKSEKPVLVDFFADWCPPCSVLAPILEKIAEDFKEKIIFIKVNLNKIPLTAQKLGIDRIPTVILFEKGKSVGGFVGLQPEAIIKNWLEEIINLKNGKRETEKEKIEKIVKEYENYAREKRFKLNPDRKIVERIIQGLLKNEKTYEKRYCPCRRVTGNAENDEKNVCPCAYHLEELEKFSHCLCQLFVK